MELIDRQALIEHLKIHCDGCGEALHCAFEAPTVDAVPVVHGRWIKTVWRTKCSVCGFSGSLFDDPINPFNYCPNCGAKMDL